MALGQRDLLALALFDLQARQRVQAVNALVVDDLASLAQLHVNHASAISAVALGQGNNLLLQVAITVTDGFVAQSTGTHANDTQRTTLAQAAADCGAAARDVQVRSPLFSQGFFRHLVFQQRVGQQPLEPTVFRF